LKLGLEGVDFCYTAGADFCIGFDPSDLDATATTGGTNTCGMTFFLIGGGFATMKFSTTLNYP